MAFCALGAGLGRMRSASLVHLLWLAPSLLLLSWIETRWPSLAVVVFVVLSLSLGFVHGAMDIFLLRDSQGKLEVKTCAAYALATGVLAAALAAWPGVALIALIAVSLWHFGEQAHFEHLEQSVAWLSRIVQGGASVMLPVLLSPHALQPWVKAIAGLDAAWVWPLWVGMAGLWCACLLAAAVVMKPWQADTHKTLWLELIALIALNLALSPLLAFALFFGLYHAGTHVCRMRRLQLRDGRAWLDPLLVATLAITWLALAALFWWMSDSSFVTLDAGLWLRWLVVALAAVTLPHLILISRSRQRLFA